MVTVDHIQAESFEYTLYKPTETTSQSIIFYPGMACNRYGHPFSGPKGLVADIIEDYSPTHTLLFPEIHMPSLTKGDVLAGLTVEEQNDRMRKILDEAFDERTRERTTLIGQSLGCLAVASLVDQYAEARFEKAVLLGPPTLEGNEHRSMLLSKFANRPRTLVNEHGVGHIEFGNGQLMAVDEAYWNSINANGLRVHHDALTQKTDTTAVSTDDDSFYPNNKQFLKDHLPTLARVGITGQSHTFKDDVSRTQARSAIRLIIE